MNPLYNKIITKLSGATSDDPLWPDPLTYEKLTDILQESVDALEAATSLCEALKLDKKQFKYHIKAALEELGY